MLERKCVKSYRSLQHRNGVTRFKQVGNSRAIMLCVKELAVNARWERKFVILSTDYSIPLLHTLVWCDQFLWTTKRCNI